MVPSKNTDGISLSSSLLSSYVMGMITKTVLKKFVDCLIFTYVGKENENDSQFV
jgi:deoxyhypusine synthase